MSVQKCFKRTTGKPSTNGRKFKTLAWAEVLHMEVLTLHACSLAQKCLILCNPTDCSPQAPLSMGLSRQEYWSGLPFPPPGDLLDPGIEPVYPVLQVDSLPLSHQGSLGDLYVNIWMRGGSQPGLWLTPLGYSHESDMVLALYSPAGEMSGEAEVGACLWACWGNRTYWKYF